MEIYNDQQEEIEKQSFILITSRKYYKIFKFEEEKGDQALQ